MSTNNKVAIIENPLPFFTETFIQKKILTDEYSKTQLSISLKDELPYKIILTFETEDLCTSFIEKYNDKTLQDCNNYKFIISKDTTNYQTTKDEISKKEKDKVPYKFDFPYENEWCIDYVLSQEKSGLLYKNEEAKKRIYKAAKYLVTKMGKNILSGKSVLNVSFPVFIFDKRTLHQAFCHEHRLAPYYLTRAAYSFDVLERLKWVIVHLISFLHLTTTQVKPFNPLIGETFQCRIGNLKLYLEQTQNHPITANFYGIDDDKTYEMYGYQITDASVTPNTCTATRLGSYFIKFLKDNTIFKIRIPDAYVKGTTFGDRLFSYENKCLVLDLTNKIGGYIEMNPAEKSSSGGIFSYFFQKRTNFPDYFKGHIVNSKYIQIDENGSEHSLLKGFTSIAKISGQWTNSLVFDDKEYWGINDNKVLTMFHDEKYMCPSDGSLRTDLQCLIKDKEDASQKEKERLEVRQRQDRKLREEWDKKRKV